MSVVDRTASQDCVKILMSKQDYVTGMETCEFTYEWTMNDIKYDPIKIKSPKFSSHYSDFNDEWILEIDPTSRVICGQLFVPMQLQPTSFNDTSQLQTKYKISVSSKKESTKADESVVEEHNFSDLSKKINWHIGCFGPTLKDVLSDEQFRNYKLKIYYFGKLLLNKKLADVTIKVGQKSFRAIKGILGARSPVFSAMFDYEQLKENKNNEVVIEDIEEDVFEEFLHFIYTGKSPKIDKMPMELLAVAEKYQVDCLKHICEKVICESINVDNIAIILVCSDRYNLKKLNEKGLEFMKKNFRRVVSNKTFQVYKKKHPEVFADILEELLLTFL
ncbi:speckle-type POZ protein-like [Aphidius gifuensis]|uniref:speckle-type POZ protein-like n=1 Tax=Aphidius gifuensis TaxID=684658 RepID=UPI001CDD3853|nr:speckle-type POZ protein-like [Aphidius gifuensis]